MKTQLKIGIASAVLLALQGCSTTPEQVEIGEGDLTKKLPPTGAGAIPSTPLYYSSIKEAEQALQGYNYGLVNLPDGRVQVFVSGLAGSGADNPITQGESSQANKPGLLAQLSREESEMPFPSISIGERKNGQAAIDALGGKIVDLARVYDMSPERLTDIFQQDSSAWIDETGHLFYIDSHHHSDDEHTQEATATVEQAPSFSEVANAADAFALHSKPGSNRVIYLDFNGHTASNTAWYSGAMTAQAYDVDGNPSAFSAKELSNIKEIWQRVAEDYAPFDVDITTEEPSASALERISSSDSQYGTRAVITRSTPQLCDQSCGGIAYVNVFSFYSSSSPGRFQPAWVFFDKLGGGYPKYVAEAISHEVGHNLNLTHDGNSTTAYYKGHGTGDAGWAPIMGVGYFKALSQWSKGEYPGATNLQDDIAVIHAAGAPLRPDDYANTLASATQLNGKADAVSQTGIIERESDIDIFSFATGGGNVEFQASADPVSPNLDVLLKLLNADGKIIAQDNPADSLSSSVNVSLAAGQYYLQVQGVGKGDLTTGYSSYGSLGQYQITGNYVPGQTLLAPNAVVSASPALGDAALNVTFDGVSSSDKDGKIAAFEWNFGDGAIVKGGPLMGHTYRKAGVYTSILTVTDNSGLKSSATKQIQVTQSPAPSGMQVKNVRVSTDRKKKRVRCVAKVEVEYEDRPVKGAKVFGSWSGSVTIGNKTVAYNRSYKKKTSKSGMVDIKGPWVKGKGDSSGTCAFTVTDIQKKQNKKVYEYDDNGNVAASYTW